jgi:hypothetical protein
MLRVFFATGVALSLFFLFHYFVSSSQSHEHAGEMRNTLSVYHSEMIQAESKLESKSESKLPKHHLKVSFPLHNQSNVTRRVSREYAGFWHLITERQWGNLMWSQFQMVLERENSIYIGFGEWIGPSLLFAMTWSRYAFGIEPQPDAYRTLRENAQLNRDALRFDDTLVLSQICIQPHAQGENVTFIGSSDSMSRHIDLAFRRMEDLQTQFQVPCFSFPIFFQHVVLPHIQKNWHNHKGAKLSGSSFLIKIDIEGGEEFLMTDSEMSQWLLSQFYPHDKPNLKISLHGSFHESSTVPILRFLRLYRYAWLYREFSKVEELIYEQVDPHFIDASTICLKECCCDILLTDVKLNS